MKTNQPTTDETWLSPGAALNRFEFLRELSVAQSRGTQAQVRYGFWLNKIGLLIPPLTPSEVIDEIPIFALPNTADWFSGFCNLRGNIIPVYDLELLFGFLEGGTDKRYLVVLDKGENAVGIVTKVLPQPHIFDESSIMPNRPPIPKHLEAYVSKAYILDQKVWFDFDHRGFFGTIARSGSSF